MGIFSGRSQAMMSPENASHESEKQGRWFQALATGLPLLYGWRSRQCLDRANHFPLTISQADKEHVLCSNFSVKKGIVPKQKELD